MKVKLNNDICEKCHNKITNPHSPWQRFCNNCHNGIINISQDKELKGGVGYMVKKEETKKKPNKQLKGKKKMTEEKEVKKVSKEVSINVNADKIEKVKKVSKTRYLTCSKCGAKKFAREDVYQARIKKFKSEEDMNANYICRNCKSADKIKQ
jgi:DNA-directed RNA polymerase subunit M/transcription elongation factor TFIIS